VQRRLIDGVAGVHAGDTRVVGAQTVSVRRSEITA